MNNLLNLLFLIMCGMGAIGFVLSTTLNDALAGTIAMCLSAICFLANAYYPLFKDKKNV